MQRKGAVRRPDIAERGAWVETIRFGRLWLSRIVVGAFGLMCVFVEKCNGGWNIIAFYWERMKTRLISRTIRVRFVVREDRWEYVPSKKRICPFFLLNMGCCFGL